MENGRVSSFATPIIVDLGQQSKKRIKKLKRGEGKLMAEIHEVLQQVQANLGEEIEGKVLLPVIIIYRRKDENSILNLFSP